MFIMPKLYKLSATVTIGNRQFESPPFHLEFEQKITAGVPTLTHLKLYNPNQDTMNVVAGKLVNTFYQGPKISISAGHEENHGTCCLGQIIHYETKRQHADMVLEMKIIDDTTSWQNALINKTYKKQMASAILRDMFSSVGITAGQMSLGSDKLMDIIVKRFYDGIYKICLETKSILYFNNGMLEIQPRASSGNIEVFDLSNSSGLIGIPEKSM